MTLDLYLLVAACVALGVGAVAALSPRTFLQAKGVAIDAPVVLWMRQVGVLIGALGLMNLWAYGEGPSRTMQALLLGNAAVHLGLLPLEPIAFARGTLTKLAGIVPNSVLHVLLASGALWFAWGAG